MAEIVGLNEGYTDVSIDKDTINLAIALAGRCNLSEHEHTWTDAESLMMAKYVIWSTQRLNIISEMASDEHLVHANKTNQTLDAVSRLMSDEGDKAITVNNDEEVETCVCGGTKDKPNDDCERCAMLRDIRQHSSLRYEVIEIAAALARFQHNVADEIEPEELSLLGVYSGKLKKVAELLKQRT